MPTSHSARLITLTTDFGLSDHYVGVMKGVIASIAPAAKVIDITHDVPAFEVAEGAFTIAQAYRWFPPKTIHVIVVDPGVGSARRPILAKLAGQYFVAPDNGVLSMITAREKGKVRHISNAKYFLQPPSQTFHGRDVFAPVAAHLARGIAPSKFGPTIDDFFRLKLDDPARTGKRTWTGLVLKTDGFGNLITNFHIDSFEQLRTRPFQFQVGLETVTRLASSFAEVPPGEPFVIAGSSGYIEAVMNQASAAKVLGCGTGSPVELTLF